MTSNSHRAFSLVEVIIALGVFVFSITILIGMLPVGLKSVRSVQNEANAVHIASSIFGFWQVAETGTSLTISDMFTNVGTVGTSSSSTNYFNEYGSQVSGLTTASISMGYNASSSGTPPVWKVELNFRWPAQAANTNGIQTRTFIQEFAK